MNLKFGTDGIRGPVETHITPEACLKIGHATGLVMKEQGWDTVMIGKDTRVSGYMLESALQAGFIAAAVNVITPILMGVFTPAANGLQMLQCNLRANLQSSFATRFPKMNVGIYL